MATLQYTVFNSATAVGEGDPVQEGVIAIGGTSAQGSVLAGTGRYRKVVRICVDANCAVTWGANPTAVADGTGGRWMGTDVSTVEYFQICAGDKIAVIER